MKTFEHGGQIEKFAFDLGCRVSEIIDLSSNINFVKPQINIDFNTLDISSYPTYDKLYEKIAFNYGVQTSQIELFNGGSSAIFTLFKHLALQTCTIYSPAYLEYKKAALNFGYELHTINRFENINENVKENSLVIFVNPSTPDGKYYDVEELMKFWIKKSCTILIDESFLDFCDKPSAIKYLETYDKLYILKSMTKFYSSAGIRVGTIVSTKENIKKLKEFEPMWKLSQFDSNYL
ncbi:MAG: aminotransferase class I/II-fold pyridoxal phosphate-dependent enzyme, partial [Arcobacter sp.]|nr:aminotransferase class I/II-fold pyridoxal phosphate-dependent enzyme [Arcobacter sp.]